MSTTTVNALELARYATPAADRYAELEVEVYAGRDEWVAAQVAELDALTVAEIRPLYAEVAVYGQPTPTKKADLIDQIIGRRWVKSPQMAELNDARWAAQWEGKIITQAVTDYASAAMGQFALTVEPQISGRGALEAAAQYALACATAEPWRMVRTQLDLGQSPIEAVAQVRAAIIGRLTTQYSLVDGLSRSTSVVSNLADDITRQGLAEWLRTTNREY